MSDAPTALFLKDPVDWGAVPGCVCASVGVGYVGDVHKVPMAAGLSGLTHDETAILAGVLTGLALFLFLLLPILCCLCPLACCACCPCGGKKKGAAAAGHRHGNLARSGSDLESFWSTGTWGGDKTDYENLYGVDMKLPRPWVDSMRGDDHFNSKVRALQSDGWEGVDMTRDEIDAAARNGGDTNVEHTEIQSYMQSQRDSGMGGSGQESMGGGGGGGGVGGGVGGGGGGNYSTVDRNRNDQDEIVTEYATTRRVDIHVGGLSQDEANDYYSREYAQDNDMSKENFMKIYWDYRNKLDG